MNFEILIYYEIQSYNALIIKFIIFKSENRF